MIIRGTVKQGGEESPMANVYLSDADGGVHPLNVRTYTDVNGVYSLNVPEVGFLTASFIGSKKTLPIKGRNVIDFDFGSNQLDEFVVETDREKWSNKKKAIVFLGSAMALTVLILIAKR